MARRRANGEGSVYQRHDAPTCPPRRPDGNYPEHRCRGTWAGALCYADPVHGWKRRQVFYGHTATEVRAKLKAARERLDAGAPVKDARSSVASYVERWVATTLAASSRKATTKETYAALAKRWIAAEPIGSLTLDRLKASDVEALMLTMRRAGKSSSTVRQTYTVLRAVLDAAVRDQLVARNAAAQVKRPSVERREARFLSPAEVRALLDGAAGSRYQPVLTVLAFTGLRRGEALALRWADVDLDAGVLRVRGTLTRCSAGLAVTDTKTDRSRRAMPLASVVVDQLRAVRRRQASERLRAGSVWTETGLAFTTETGAPVDSRNLLRLAHDAARRAGLEGVSLHTLRHSAASAMLSEGVPLKVVSDLLGHSSVAITGDVYGHVAPDLAREALDRLSAALGG